MTFWEIGVGLWSTAHFVYNSGGSRGGAWEARAPLLFLDQTEVAPKGPKKIVWRPPHHPYLRVWMIGCPPPPPYLKVWIRHCIIISLLLTCASKAFACLVVLVGGKFDGIRVSKSSINFVLLQRMKQNINYQTT